MRRTLSAVGLTVLAAILSAGLLLLSSFPDCSQKETKRSNQESLGSGKSITFMGIVVIWGNAFMFILRVFQHEVVEKH